MPANHEELSDTIFKQIAPFLESNNTKKILVGYSGGLDSTVLLHLVACLADKLTKIIIQPIHINHGVNQSAEQWVRDCELFCKQLNLELLVCNYSLEKIKSNREATYRQARYEAFAENLGENGLLLTAHHQQDQVETVLFNLFRGAGVSGLRGMQPLREFDSGYHLRPLLSIPLKCLLEYARHYDLPWIDDPSNKDLNLDRNFIRHEILPVIAKRWPASQASISRSAELLNQTEVILNDIAQQDISEAEVAQFPGVIKDLYFSVLDIKVISDLSEERLLNLLNSWLVSFSLNLSSDQLFQIHQNLSQKPNSGGMFEFNDFQIRVYKGFLYLMEKLPQSEIMDIEFTNEGNNFLFEQLDLRLEANIRNDVEVEFKLRQGGETIRLNNRTKSLKTIYQEKLIPPWERDLIPLIYSDGSLIAVPAVVYADKSVVKKCCLSKYMSENT